MLARLISLIGLSQLGTERVALVQRRLYLPQVSDGLQAQFRHRRIALGQLGL